MINFKKYSLRQLVIGFFIVCLIFYMYSDAIISWLNFQNPILILAISIILYPINILVLYLLYQIYKLRGLISGILFIIAIDIMSIPHMFTKIGMPSQKAIDIISDYVVFGILPKSWNEIIFSLPILGDVSLSTVIIYLIIPSIMVLIGIMIAERKSVKSLFIKAINGGGS